MALMGLVCDHLMYKYLYQNHVDYRQLTLVGNACRAPNTDSNAVWPLPSFLSATSIPQREWDRLYNLLRSAQTHDAQIVNTIAFRQGD